EVDFKGFQDAVNAVGGIPLWFDRAMRDSNSGLDVEHPGCVVLDGYKALGFARARHLRYMLNGEWHYDGTGDLGRISRQQLFLRKTIDVAERKGLGNPLVLKHLVEAATKNLTIDKGISASDLVALAQRFRSFDGDALKTLTMPATPFTTSGGAQVLHLDTTAAEPILNIFRGKSLADVTEKSVHVTVLNSSGTDGEATAVAAALHGAGLGIARWGNGTELDHPDDAHTSIRYADGAQAAAGLVARHLTVAASATEDSSLAPGEVVLFVGHDFTTVQARRKPMSATTSIRSTATAASTGSSSGSSGTTSTSGPTTTAVGRVPGATPPGESC
ncbi:MAG TPA: LCP family protein, partial [Acidimicrobiales bacterium]